MNDITKRFLECYKALLRMQIIENAKDFTQQINVSKSLISDISYGRTNVGVTALKNLIKTYNVNSDWLFTGEGTMFNETKGEAHTYSNADYDLKELIKFYCKQKNITVKELASRIGMSEANIYSRFRKNSMELEHLKKIAEVLNIPIESLVSNHINIVGENHINYQRSEKNSSSRINISKSDDDAKMEVLTKEIENMKNYIELQKEKICSLNENIASLKKIIGMLEKE